MSINDKSPQHSGNPIIINKSGGFSPMFANNNFLDKASMFTRKSGTPTSFNAFQQNDNNNANIERRFRIRFL